MKTMADFDKNFKYESIHKDDMKVYDVEEAPFKLYGIMKPDGDEDFIRMPRDVAKSVSEGVAGLSRNTAGGRVRFKTNSKYIAVKCVYPEINVMLTVPFSGSVCADVYADGKFVTVATPGSNFIADFYEKGGARGEYPDPMVIEKVIEFPDNKMRDIIINFPISNALNKMYIGIEETAEIKAGDEYKHTKPIVFYGSSVTQNVCVSRAGNAYSAILSRWFDTDFVNLGFAGSAKGETEMAEYIAGLDMSVFVYDYDHNAPSVEHLKNTHYPMYKIIRDANPDLPIIMASMPCFSVGVTHILDRRDVIKETYERAIAEGDKNVYFVDGIEDIYKHIDPEIMTVDNCHPNDFGSYCMADVFGKIIKNLLI